MSESPASAVVAEPPVVPLPVAEALPAATPITELPSLKPGPDMRNRMGLPPVAEKPAEKPAPTAAETAEMQKLLQAIQAHPPEQPTMPLPAEEMEVPQPTNDSGEKKEGGLKGLIGGIKAAAVGAIVFILTKLKTLLNFGIDDPQ